MKVNSNLDNSFAANGSTASAAAKNAPNAMAKATANMGTQSAGVAVSVSTMVRSLKLSSADHADIDTAKVESMRKAISNGTYVVNPGAIADKLLSNVRETLQRARG